MLNTQLLHPRRLNSLALMRLREAINSYLNENVEKMLRFDKKPISIDGPFIAMHANH